MERIEVEIFHFNKIKGGKVKLPTAFTEKGLYMLATIIKSPRAVQTTLELNLAAIKVKHTVKKGKK